MKCPHCGKDSETEYVIVSGLGHIDRQLAETALGQKLGRLDALAKRGAYAQGTSPSFKTDDEVEYDKILRECTALEVALGY